MAGSGWVEHFVDQRQLAILDRQLLGARAEEAVFEVLDAEFEQALFTAPLFTELPQQCDGLFDARRLGIRSSQHAKIIAITLPRTSRRGPYLLVIMGFQGGDNALGFTSVSTPFPSGRTDPLGGADGAMVGDGFSTDRCR